MKISKELAKGSTALLVLSVISKRDMYGYQIIKTIEMESEEVFTLNEGTLYPILHSFEKNGYLTSYKEGAEGGRERKYYKITAAGKLFLQTHLEEWSYFTSVVNKVLAGEN